MSNNELEQLKSLLLNKETLQKEYLLAWRDTYKELKEIDETHREFPTWGKLLSDVLDKAEKDPLTYIRTLPLELEANSEALLTVMARNNERMLRFLELFGNKPF